MTAAWQCELDADGVVRLAELLALRLKVGSVVALRGELGRRQDHAGARRHSRTHR